MRIGLISDTHGKLPAEVFKIFNGLDHIVHAGDIGDAGIITDLEAICPVNAVHGNIDDWHVSSLYPAIVFVQFLNKTICAIHQVPDFKDFTYKLFKKDQKADIVIYGHTHRQTVTTYRNILFINPGSIHASKDTPNGSVAILDLNKSVLSPEFIEI